MKTKHFLYLLFIFINAAVVISCNYYPVSRDEFFYIDKADLPNPFLEYYNSYLYVNPRINQFFTNVISRFKWIEIIFGLLLFNGFFTTLFLSYYRRLPRFLETTDMKKYLVFTAFFVFAINYFGEMFFYTPFSTNYTLSHIFYLLYIFLFTDYYFYKNNRINKIPLTVLIIGGIYTGMSNEHIPPVLLAASFFSAVYFLIRAKKLPDFKMITYNISLLTGYLLLFFAPANKIKEQSVKKSPFDISFIEYFQNLTRIFKFYFFYNIELIAIVLVVFVFCVFNFRKLHLNSMQKKSIFLYLALALFSLAIVGLSPLTGVRLMFFSTILFILTLYIIINTLFEKRFKFKKILVSSAFAWIIVFFIVSIVITFNADRSYKTVMNEISKKSSTDKNVILSNHFDYSTSGFGWFNRKILLEDGTSYIDKDATHNTSQENNLIKYFQIKSISHK